MKVLLEILVKFVLELLLTIDDIDPSLGDVSVLFFPVVRSFHIYLFVIDLRQPSFQILDNIMQDDTVEARYSSLPSVIESLAQDSQLNKLHVKYLNKVLRLDNNVHKSRLLVQASSSQHLPSNQQDQILKDAAESIHARLEHLS
ncbi:hypothetical protein L2E82_45259 [Cichorium intybus]|uniref:Uncharacterized protein n=1 Tax=Cichorium intybus TaxID=13427 RepID=A0ACB8ZTU2_CICIN|nr:hypothetical protein L2E82_45259 [Cichorium intybus]